MLQFLKVEIVEMFILVAILLLVRKIKGQHFIFVDLFCQKVGF